MIKTTFQILGQEQIISLNFTVTTMYPAIYLSIHPMDSPISELIWKHILNGVNIYIKYWNEKSHKILEDHLNIPFKSWGKQDFSKSENEDQKPQCILVNMNINLLYTKIYYSQSDSMRRYVYNV